jgi:threonine/homoserine/homoserine lactone efflux protein
MPDLMKILLLLLLGLVVLVFFSERNPIKLSAEQQGRMGKWFMILIGLILIASAVKSCT